MSQNRMIRGSENWNFYFIFSSHGHKDGRSIYFVAANAIVVVSIEII